MGKIFVKAPADSPDDFAKSISEGAKQFGLGALQSGAAFTDPRQVSSFGDFARLIANPFIAGYRGLTQGTPLTDREKMELNSQMRREIEERMQGQRTMDKLRALSLDPASERMFNFPVGQDGFPASDEKILNWARQEGGATNAYALSRLATNLEQAKGSYDRGAYLGKLRGEKTDEKTGAEDTADQITNIEGALTNVGGAEFTPVDTQRNINNLASILNQPDKQLAPAAAAPVPPPKIEEVKFGIGADEELANDAKQMEDSDKTDDDGEIRGTEDEPFTPPGEMSPSPTTGRGPPRPLDQEVNWNENDGQ